VTLTIELDQDDVRMNQRAT